MWVNNENLRDLIAVVTQRDLDLYNEYKTLDSFGTIEFYANNIRHKGFIALVKFKDLLPELEAIAEKFFQDELGWDYSKVQEKAEKTSLLYLMKSYEDMRGHTGLDFKAIESLMGVLRN